MNVLMQDVGQASGSQQRAMRLGEIVCDDADPIRWNKSTSALFDSRISRCTHGWAASYLGGSPGSRPEMPNSCMIWSRASALAWLSDRSTYRCCVAGSARWYAWL